MGPGVMPLRHRAPALLLVMALLLTSAAGCGTLRAGSSSPDRGGNALIERPVRVLAESGAWTWFNDERALVAGPYLYVGHVDSAGYSSVTTYPVEDDAALSVKTTRLSSFREVDDHDNPALLRLSDGRVLATYAQHHEETHWYWRYENAAPQRIDWSPEQRTEAVGVKVTYNNLFQLTAEEGRLYNFFRGLNYDATLMTSDDGGQTWSAPRHFIQSAGGDTRPYVKYASDGKGRIDLLYTQGHPRKVENNVYHLYYAGGALHKSDGTVICRVEQPGCLPVAARQGTKIYDAAQAGRGWVWDIEYASGGAPVGAYITARDSTVGRDLRYRYARYDTDAGAWREQEIAHAGTYLYDDERHYAGGITIDPARPRTVYVSADVHPQTGDSTATGRYQIWRGAADGNDWTWTQVTQNRAVDNLRPFVPRGSERSGHRALLWLRGRYTTYEDYDTAVVGMVD